MDTHERGTADRDLGPPVLLKFDEAARLLHISRSRMYELVARGEVPGLFTFGRSRRISRTALERWIAEQVDAPDTA